MKRMLFVYNPNSGKAQIKNHLFDIVRIFSDGGYDVTVYPTKFSKDGYNKVIENEGKYDIIACSGGDGTLNEVVSAMMEYKEKLPIGYIPSGSTNDFAVSLGIPKNMQNAALHIVTGHQKSCDVGVFNGRYFNYIAGVGAFTEVSYDTSQGLKNMFGHQAYILESVKSIPNIKPFRMTIETEYGIEEDEFLYGMISNATTIAGIKRLAGKDVIMNDGYFELTFVRKTFNPIDVQSALTDFISGNRTSKAIYSTKVKKVKLTSDRDLPWVLDGEYGGLQREVTIEVKEKAYDILVTK